MSLAGLLVAACLLQLGQCRSGAGAADYEAKDSIFSKAQRAGTFYYWADLTVDAETPCEDFRKSTITKVVLKNSLKAALNEIAGSLRSYDLIGAGRVRCRDSLSGGTIRLVQVIVETQPGAEESLANRTAEAFLGDDGTALFLTKLGNRLTNTEGVLKDYKSASLATYKGGNSTSRATPREGQSPLGFGTEPPPKPEFNAEEDLEILPCFNANPATCPSLCTCNGNCTNGVCRVSEDCADDSECNDNDTCGKTKCDTAEGKCVYATDDTPCKNPFLFGRDSVCSGTGYCRICRTGEDCTGNDEDGSCFTCDVDLNECLPKTDGEECTAGSEPGFCSNGECKECASDDDCDACQACEGGTCGTAADGTKCFLGYAKKPTGFCADGACKDCATTANCPTDATCSSNECTCSSARANRAAKASATKEVCYKADGTISCSDTYVQLCQDAQCKTNQNFCVGDFTDLSNFFWNETTVNLGVYTSSAFTLVLYKGTGYKDQIKSISATGKYDYFAQNGGKLLSKTVLSLKLS